MRLLAVWVRLSQATLQVLAHAHHARVITCRAVYLGTLCATLKLIETTGSAFTGVWPTMSILNVASLHGLLARVDARKRRSLSMHLLLRLLVLRICVAAVHDMLLGQLVLVSVVIEVIAAIHAIIIVTRGRHLQTSRIRLVF